MTEKALIIEGFDELLKALREAPKRVMPYLKKAMTVSVRAVQERVSEYPPSSEANRPGRVDKNGRPMGYYERGRGWWYPVMAEKTLGSKLGVSAGAQTAKQAARRFKVKSVPTVAGYKLAAGGTSEMLGRSWDARVFEQENAILGVVGNNASYAEYVQGNRQAAVHAARGWKTVDKTLEESMNDINDAFGLALQEYLENEF